MLAGLGPRSSRRARRGGERPPGPLSNYSEIACTNRLHFLQHPPMSGVSLSQSRSRQTQAPRASAPTRNNTSQRNGAPSFDLQQFLEENTTLINRALDYF